MRSFIFALSLLQCGGAWAADGQLGDRARDVLTNMAIYCKGGSEMPLSRPVDAECRETLERWQLLSSADRVPAAEDLVSTLQESVDALMSAIRAKGILEIQVENAATKAQLANPSAPSPEEAAALLRRVKEEEDRLLAGNDRRMKAVAALTEYLRR